MSSEPVQIRVSDLGKAYQIYARPQDRLKQFLARGRRRYFREFWALQGIDLEVRKGEVIGIIGRNGAGKSTLLQLLCGTLNPTQGEIEVQGRIAALLELGAGFNPEFSGRENVFLNAAIMGLSQQEIERRYPAIAEFAGIGDFIDQPVKTYSSGMFVRLAFAVATSVDPDILIIDEALSVGDGAFARKSFDRIMQLKEKGATILFCSHSMYQIDALCDRALWLEQGRQQMLDKTQRVTVAYNDFLSQGEPRSSGEKDADAEEGRVLSKTAAGTARIRRIEGFCNGNKGKRLEVESGLDSVGFSMDFASDPALPCPTVAFAITNRAGVGITSVILLGAEQENLREADGTGHAVVYFPNLPLLKGSYSVTAYLACERGLHVYEAAPHCLSLEVRQQDVTQGVVALPHYWEHGRA
ncbi:ABC transporter ATP-binding protein [Magnetovirga frankeli]|uniref:ABC transporter ATP-binding protein n=1 Tax=Magnetovirga frankeli TaxID=947516 RepID=UPI0012931373|nr:ABC transporter ATP-binding protein [gamma proteobacterium SS-5]